MPVKEVTDQYYQAYGDQDNGPPLAEVKKKSQPDEKHYHSGDKSAEVAVMIIWTAKVDQPIDDED
jgi:hypothetical protein